MTPPPILPLRACLGLTASLVLAWAPLAQDGPGAAPSPVDGPAVHPGPASLAPAEGAPPRIEHFVLELGAGPDPRPVGVLRWIGRREAADLELEWELDFPSEGLRLLAVERLGVGGARLTWRELQDRTSRSLVAEWAPAGEEIVLREWARDGALRESRSLATGAVLPLYLLELARAGSVAQGEFQVFEPTARGLTRLTLRTTYDLAERAVAEGGGVRVGAAVGLSREVELRRDDGSLAGRYRFRGEELLAFEWQDGGVRGRRVEGPEYERALEAARPLGEPGVAGDRPSPPAR